MLGIIVSLCLIWVTLQFVIQSRRQALLFQQAQRRAKITNRPLVVFGDPKFSIFSSRLFGISRPCGDVCIDTHGCWGCEKTSVRQKIPEILPEIETDSCVGFVSSVLSFIDDQYIETVIYDLQRICGPDNLFVIEPQYYDFRLWMSGFRRVFLAYPPNDEEFKWINFEDKSQKTEPRNFIEALPNIV